MIPNRIVRYFFYLGYSLDRAGWTSFSLFKTSLIQFYLLYLQHEYWCKDPCHYPRVYGLN